MKRTTMSDIDSECDEVFTDDSKGSHRDEDGCHILNRKRRRGIIEKRRRDRINSSLSELRRLVPAAFEKQGSAKLEKAEILQLTVDHLKILHSTGLDPFYLEAQQFSMDYHGIGFRECAAEVARYLVGMEGLDLQDPLRMRLLSHLQCFAAQRDLAIKSATSSSPWSPLFSSLPAVPSPQYPPVPRASLATSLSNGSSLGSMSDTPHGGRHSSSMSSETSAVSSSSPSSSHHHHPGPRTPVASSSMRRSSVSSSVTFNSPHRTSTDSPNLTKSRYSSEQGFASFPSTSTVHPNSNVRPYRPWSTEVAY